jgi:hypothetical protein
MAKFEHFWDEGIEVRDSDRLEHVGQLRCREISLFAVFTSPVRDESVVSLGAQRFPVDLRVR